MFRFVSGSIGARMFPVNYSNSLLVTVARAGKAVEKIASARAAAGP